MAFSCWRPPRISEDGRIIRFRRYNSYMSDSEVMSDTEFPTQRRGGSPHMKRDLTEGPITKTLIMFSLPLLGTNALQSLNF